MASLSTDPIRPTDFPISNHPFTPDYDAWHDGEHCGWRYGVWHGDIHYCGARRDHHVSQAQNVIDHTLEQWREQAAELRARGLGQHVQINLESIDMIIGHCEQLRRAAIRAEELRPIRIEIPQDHALVKVETLRYTIENPGIELDSITLAYVAGVIDELFGKRVGS